MATSSHPHGRAGLDIPYQEGLMLIVSTVVMTVAIAIWAIIDHGNRMDRLQSASINDQAQPGRKQAKRPSSEYSN